MRLGLRGALGAGDAEAEDMQSVTVSVNAFGERLQQQAEIPRGPTPTRRLLPLFRSLTEAMVERAVARAEAQGKVISCRRGCGACCRQLVPIPPAEAYALAEVVEGMPESDRARARARFADASRRIEASGLLERLRGATWEMDTDVYYRLALEYFALGIPCPFLDDAEACGIYPDRPLICREFLVTSPPEHCSSPASRTVQAVELPGQVSRKLSALDRAAGNRAAPWLPLTLALDWAAAHPEQAPTRTGVEHLEVFTKEEGGSGGSRPKGKKGKGRRRARRPARFS